MKFSWAVRDLRKFARGWFRKAFAIVIGMVLLGEKRDGGPFILVLMTINSFSELAGSESVFLFCPMLLIDFFSSVYCAIRCLLDLA